MFQLASNQEIGSYLAVLIDERFHSRREFCAKYLEIEGIDPIENEIQKMSCRISQIIQGKKAVQLRDLPIFTQILNTTCEAILSAGHYLIPVTDRMTNYQVAFTHDSNIWNEYIQQNDQIILNSDEYGKTVLDYALECKNYDFMKYLMEQGYIWFDSGNPSDYVFSFGAGTSIKRKTSPSTDALTTELQEKDALRTAMICLAIQHDDCEMLDKLRAREVPSMYQACCLSCGASNLPEQPDQNMIDCIANGNKKILDYFSKEFEIEDHFHRAYPFLFPYLEDVITQLLRSKRDSRIQYVKEILECCIQHNQKIYTRLMEFQTHTTEYFKLRFPELNQRELIDTVQKQMQHELTFSANNRILSYHYTLSAPYDGVVTNIFAIEVHNDDPAIQSLIDALNISYEKIVTLCEA